MLEFDNKKLNIFVGCLVAIISIVFVFTYNYLKISESLLNTNIYKVKIDSIAGIKKNQPVNIGGYSVGFVKDILIDNNSPLLILNVDKNIEITTDAMIQMSNISLFSSAKSISIVNGIDEELLTNNSYIIDSNLGIDLDQLLNLIQMYLKSKIKPEN